MDRRTEMEKEKEENKIEFRDSFDDIEKTLAPCFGRLSFFNPLANIRVRVEAIEKWCCYYEKLAIVQSFLEQFIVEISDGYYLLSCCKNKILFTLLFRASVYLDFANIFFLSSNISRSSAFGFNLSNNAVICLNVSYSIETRPREPAACRRQQFRECVACFQSHISVSATAST